MLGVRTMLHELDPEFFPEGFKITAAKMQDEKVYLKLEFTIAIFDNGESCCEHRYMTTYDDLQSLVGHELRHIKAMATADIRDTSEEHEIVFVEIGTDVGFVTIVNHNEHNGNYGGFGLIVTKEDMPPAQ